MTFAHCVDEDLCIFVETSSTKVIFYSIKKKEIINKLSLRIPKSFGDGETAEIHCAFYCKEINTLIFYAWYNHIYSLQYRSEKYGIFAYDLSEKSYKCIVPNIGVLTDYCFNYENRFAFFASYENALYVVNSDLSFKRIKLNINRNNEQIVNFDEEKGLMLIHSKQDHYDGYTYYGDGTEFTAIDFDGNIQPWQPARRYSETQGQSKKMYIDFEDYVYEHGIDGYVAENLSDKELETISEELLQGGYNWALAKIEERAKEAGLGLYEFLVNKQIPEDEAILYSVGWLQAEMENGGIEQYFSNGDKKEFDLLIKALTTVGATQTAEAIKKGARMISTFNKKQSPTDYDCEKLSEKFENLESELTEDYASLTVKYLKNSKLN